MKQLRNENKSEIWLIMNVLHPHVPYQRLQVILILNYSFVSSQSGLYVSRGGWLSAGLKSGAFFHDGDALQQHAVWIQWGQYAGNGRQFRTSAVLHFIAAQTWRRHIIRWCRVELAAYNTTGAGARRFRRPLCWRVYTARVSTAGHQYIRGHDANPSNWTASEVETSSWHRRDAANSPGCAHGWQLSGIQEAIYAGELIARRQAHRGMYLRQLTTAHNHFG